MLKQLVAYVGEDTFIDGLRAYFRDHAWGNTPLDDLMSAIGAAAGRDLDGLDDRVAGQRRHRHARPARPTTVECRVGPDGTEPRPHRLDIGSYAERPDGLERAATTAVETAGASTPVDLGPAELHLLNDDDLTFAAVRSDERNTATMLARAGDLPDPLSRGLAVTTGWDMVVKGELPTVDFLDSLLDVLTVETPPPWSSRS